jgi:hypothetical protein
VAIAWTGQWHNGRGKPRIVSAGAAAAPAQQESAGWLGARDTGHGRAKPQSLAGGGCEIRKGGGWGGTVRSDAGVTACADRLPARGRRRSRSSGARLLAAAVGVREPVLGEIERQAGLGQPAS